MAKASLSAALARGLAGGDLSIELYGLELERAADARALTATLERWPVTGPGTIDGPLGVLAGLYQSAEDEEVQTILADAFPAVHALYDRALAHFAAHPGADTLARDLVSMLDVYALYGSAGGMERVVAAAREPRLAEALRWSVIFSMYANEGHPAGAELFEALRDPLPTGFAAVAFIDACNTLAREERLGAHPFATAVGVAALEGWLRDADPSRFSYAHSAAAALPFLAPDERARLLARAAEHPDAGVRLEAAWADATSGGRAGVAVLVRACLEVHTAALAMRYLRELGREDAIPREALGEDFGAQTEASRWLQHPSELGRTPEELSLHDTRVLGWPPTGDRRRVWLFRYVSGDHRGLIMVGSVTFALFGEATYDLAPEDAYALHCCWELDMNRDPRAPKKRSIAAGRKLLGFAPRRARRGR